MRILLHITARYEEPYELPWKTESYLIGRSSGTDLVVRDPAISRRHARLFREQDEMFIEDLGSHNGTWLNNSEVTGTEKIMVGDIIELARNPDNLTCALTIRILDGDLSTYGNITVIKSMRDLLRSQDEVSPLVLENKDELREYAKRVRWLNELHAGLSNTRTSNELLELTLNRLDEMFKPGAIMVYLKDTEGKLAMTAKRHTEACENPHFPDEFIQEYVDQATAVLVQDTLHDGRYAEHEVITEQNIRTIIATPLSDGEGCLGLILAFTAGNKAEYTEKDLDLIASVANVATLRIRNYRLQEEATRNLQHMVAERTAELNQRKEELETLDAIVRTINMEHTLAKVLQRVLEQGLVLFPQTEGGLFLLRDPHDDLFHVEAQIGHSDSLMEVTVSEREAISHYTGSSQQIENGVYLANNRNLLSGPCGGEHNLPIPQSMLVMSMKLNEQVEGILVLESPEVNAFEESDLRRLARFRDHATSAVSKARLLHSLEIHTQEVTHTRDQLIMREKMASLGRLTQGVSHEINNPNNYMRGSATNLLDKFNDFRDFLYQIGGEDLEPEIKDHFEEWFAIFRDHTQRILRGSHQIEKIVKDLRLVSRLDEAPFKHVDVLESLAACVNLLQPQYTNRVEVCCDFRGPVDMDCYPAELNQVFMNLIDNACEAMVQQQGEEQPETPGTLWINVRRDQERATIQFKDTGPGIPDEVLAHIYEAFISTKSSGKNPGLGLFTCYKIMEKHGGAIRIMNPPEGGTSITLELPFARPTTEGK